MAPGYADPSFTVIMIRRFPAEDVRRRQFEVEDKLQHYISAKSVAVPLPAGAPANFVRFTMSDQRRTVQVSEQSAQLTLDFGTTPPKQGIVASLANGVAAFKVFDEVFTNQERYYISLILQADVPFPSLKSRPRFVKAELYDKLTAEAQLEWLNIEISLVKNNHTWLFSANNYKNLEIQLTSPADAINVDTDFVAPTRMGVQLKFELNTKPALDSPKVGQMPVLLSELKAMAAETAERVLEPALWAEVAGVAKL